MGTEKVTEVEDLGVGEFSLTPQTMFALEYIAPPAAISDYVTTLYHFRCDEPVIRDIQPAAVGHLAIFPHGVGAMHFADGRRDPSHQTNLMTPFSQAAPFMVHGPFHAIGAVLSPLGWAALTDLHAGDHADRLYRAGDWLGPQVEQLGQRLCEGYREGDVSGRECAAQLCDFIEANVREVRPRHRALIAEINAWLGSSFDPQLAQLNSRLDYSERQIQRLTERFFGLGPRALARKYRALRTAALLSLPQLTPDFEGQIAEAFYDQSHMIREIRLFAGRTPTRLGSDDTPYLTEMLDVRNFREVEFPGLARRDDEAA